MILQALNDYYRRKCDDADPAQRLPAFGLEQKEIPFILEIKADGALIHLHDTREQQGKKLVAQNFRVPQGVKKASGVAANLLWDTLEYVLGADTTGKPERVVEQQDLGCHAAFTFRAAIGRVGRLQGSCPSATGSRPADLRRRSSQRTRRTGCRTDRHRAAACCRG